MIYYAISKEDEKEILDTFDKMENGDMLPGMESTDYTCRVFILRISSGRKHISSI